MMVHCIASSASGQMYTFNIIWTQLGGLESFRLLKPTTKRNNACIKIYAVEPAVHPKLKIYMK